VLSLVQQINRIVMSWNHNRAVAIEAICCYYGMRKLGFDGNGLSFAVQKNQALIKLRAQGRETVLPLYPIIGPSQGYIDELSHQLLLYADGKLVPPFPHAWLTSRTYKFFHKTIEDLLNLGFVLNPVSVPPEKPLLKR
jgi:hypothetical protein